MTDAFTWLVVRVQNGVANAREREEGQTFVEYALLLAGIAILLIVAIIFLKDRIAKLFSDTGSSLQNPSAKLGLSNLRAGPTTPVGPALVFSGKLQGDLVRWPLCTQDGRSICQPGARSSTRANGIMRGGDESA